VEVLLLTDRPVELVAEHIDVAIRAGEVPDSRQLCVAIAQATGAASPVDAASRQFCPGSGW
jgi:DNA-binding transcriptional LysR family regulator